MQRNAAVVAYVGADIDKVVDVLRQVFYQSCLFWFERACLRGIVTKKSKPQWAILCNESLKSLLDEAFVAPFKACEQALKIQLA